VIVCTGRLGNSNDDCDAVFLVFVRFCCFRCYVNHKYPYFDLQKASLHKLCSGTRIIKIRLYICYYST